MFWTIVISFGVCLIIILMIGQYILVSRSFYFDKTMSDLRQLKHDVIMTLSSEVINGNQDRKYLLELRELIDVLEATISDFEVLEPNTFAFKPFKKILVNIQFSLQKAASAMVDYDDKIAHFKIRLFKIFKAA